MKKVLIYISVMFSCILIIPMLIVGLGSGSAFFSDTEPDTDMPDVQNTDGVTGGAENPVTGINNSFETPGSEGLPDSLIINVYNASTKTIFQIPLEEYIVNVVIAEMPSYFELEALKAQAVAARTYTYKKFISGGEDDDHKGAIVCTDSTHCQAYKELNKVVDSTPDKNGRGSMEAAERITRVKKAVEETKGMIACYNGEPIEALYHSCSGGMTEDSKNVWSKSLPYLVSVKSDGEEFADTRYKSTVTISKKVFTDKLSSAKTGFSAEAAEVFKSIKSIKRSSSGRILSMQAGGVEINGREMRSIFNLNSANIVFSENGDNIVMTMLGFGHGVGMSQFGADARAREGMKFDEILKYYYKGIEIEIIN